MRNFIIILLASFALTSVATAHSEVCEDLKECRELLKQVQYRIKELQGNIPVVLGDLLRNEDGSVLDNINQDQANKACKEQGLRLPTARELAVNATKYGAEMLELSDVPSGKAPRGYYLVYAANPGYKRDSFYYTDKNYQRPAGDLGHFIWTSSLNPNYIDYAYGFNTYFGSIGSYNLYDRNTNVSARCVVSSAGVE